MGTGLLQSLICVVLILQPFACSQIPAFILSLALFQISLFYYLLHHSLQVILPLLLCHSLSLLLYCSIILSLPYSVALSLYPSLALLLSLAPLPSLYLKIYLWPI